VEEKAILRGNYAAKIDDKGRLKIPNAFRAVIQAQHGTELFVTSLTGESVMVYPMPVWVALEEKLARIPTTHPARGKYAARVNYFGQVAEIDSQGRVVIHQRLRDAAGMLGEVDVFGQYDVLSVWNHERFVAKLQQDAFTEGDARALSEFGI
jgi:MraZ protein